MTIQNRNRTNRNAMLTGIAGLTIGLSCFGVAAGIPEDSPNPALSPIADPVAESATVASPVRPTEELSASTPSPDPSPVSSSVSGAPSADSGDVPVPPSLPPTDTPTVPPVATPSPVPVPDPVAATVPSPVAATPVADCEEGFTMAEDYSCVPNTFWDKPDYPTYTLPPCLTEDSTNCYWDAQTMGNGQGNSFINLNGEYFYKR